MLISKSDVFLRITIINQSRLPFIFMQVRELWKGWNSWHDQTIPSYAVAIKPDGKQLIAVSNMRVNVFDIKDGTPLINGKKGHAAVYAVACDVSGKFFAVAGADKATTVWDSEQNKPVLRFVLNDSASCLAFSPTGPVLLACAGGDFSKWDPRVKNVHMDTAAK